MGSWYLLGVFDKARFSGEVRPALRAGPDHPLVAAEIAKIAEETVRYNAIAPWTRMRPVSYRGLDAYLDQFDEMLTSCAVEPEELSVVDGQLAFGSRRQAGGDTWGWEEFGHLLEPLVTRTCLSALGFFGRRCAVGSLNRDEVPRLHPETAALADALAWRWSVWQRWNACGLRGYLTPQEAARFAGLLPQVLGVNPAVITVEDLALVRELAATARSAGQGLLWGADLRVAYPELWLEYDGGDHTPAWTGERFPPDG